jgi:WhiB family redox-sensing transcriptional regulator
VSFVGPFSLSDPQPWAGSALCAQIGDDSLWFPDTGGDVTAAKLVCASCEVQAKCLAWALETEEQYGVLGGYSPRERVKLRRGETLPVMLEDRVEAARARKNRSKKICRHCGGEYHSSKSRYCSVLCRDDAAAARRKDAA